MEAATEEDMVTEVESAWAWAWVECFRIAVGICFRIAVGIISLSPFGVLGQATSFLESIKDGGGVGYGFPRRDADTIN